MATFLLDAVAWSRPLTWFTFIRKPIGLSSTSIACLPLNYATIPAAPQDKCCTLHSWLKQARYEQHYFAFQELILPGADQTVGRCGLWGCQHWRGSGGSSGSGGAWWVGWGLGLELDSWNSHSTGGWIPGEGGSRLLTYTFHPQNTLLSQAEKPRELVNWKLWIAKIRWLRRPGQKRHFCWLLISN